jgi:putative flippase GtrA
MTNTFRIWLKFNAVGALGIIVQLGVLALMKSGIGLYYLPATAIAVETAVLHNFVWHERWTWFERRSSTRGMIKRLARFHLANGVVSVCGNLALMWLFVARFRIGYFPASLLSIATCSTANFWASDRFVFRLERGNVTDV